MTSHIWIGGAPAVAQVESVTFPDDVEAGQTISFAIGVQTLEVPLTESTRDLIIAEVVFSWNASTIPEVAEITAAAVLDDNSDLTGVMTLTADTAGKPFAVTVSIGSGNNEVQVITLSGTAATGGTFALTFDGQTTGTIAYNASAATVKAAIEALSNVTASDITCTGTGPWTVEFGGTLAGTNVALMTIDTTNLTGGVNEVQTISSPSSPTGGTFTLSFGGEATAGIAYNASAATIEAALELLTTIPSGSVSCGGGALPGTPVTMTFQDELASSDVDLLVADSSGLTGVTGSAAETTAGGSIIKSKAIAWWDFETTVGATADIDDVIAGVGLSPNPVQQYSHNGFASGKVGNGYETTNAGGVLYYNGSDNSYLAGEAGVDISFSAWVKFNSVGGTAQTILRRSNQTGTSWDYKLELNSTSNFEFTVNGSTDVVATETGVTAVANTWYHVVGVIDATNSYVRISVDGAAFVSTAGTTNLGASTLADFRLLGGPSNSQMLIGFLDCVGAFDGALTIAEVGDLYNAGTGEEYPFLSAGSNEVQTLTLSGSPSAGSVTVSYQGVGVDVPYDATASEAEVLLDTVSTIGSGNTNVTGGPWPGTPLVVEFINGLAVTDVEMLDINTSALVLLVTETTPGVTDPVGTVATTVTPLTQTATTASEGPNDWSIAANFNTNTVPVNGDTVYISDTDVSILYGLDQSAVTLAALYIEQTFTGFIGLPRANADGTNSYFEYRDSYLKIRATLLNIGDKEGDGSDRIKIDLGSVQSTILITDSGSGEDANTPAILLLGTHASNVIDINRGSLGVAYYPTEVSTVATLRQAFFDDASSDTTVYLGTGVTVTDIIKTGGDLDINSATTTFQQDAGETTIHAGAHASIDLNDGTLNYNSTGTATAIGVAGDAVLNFNQDRRPKAVTTITKKSEGSEVFDDSECITAPVVVMQNIKDLGQLHFGSNNTLTIT